MDKHKNHKKDHAYPKHDIQKLLLTEEQEITKHQFRALMLQIYNEMKEAYVKGHKLYFHNPLGLTPEQVVAGFGDDAVEILRLHALLKEVLNIVIPGTIPDDGNCYK